MITDAPMVLDLTRAEGELLRAAATELAPPTSALRVAALVPASAPCVTGPYLDAGALVRRVEVVAAPTEPRLRRSAARPFHDVCAITPGTQLREGAGLGPGSLELVLLFGEVLTLADAAAVEIVDGLLAALAPGGRMLVGASARADEALARAGLVRRRGDVLVVERPRGDPSPGAAGPSWAALDRCACVDRGRVLAAIEAPVNPPPATRPLASWSALRGRLEELVDDGRGDPALGLEVLREARALARPERPAGAPGRVDVLVVAPHPDDETVYFGGTVAAAAAAGLSIHVATLTAGEGGLDLRGDVSASTLGDHRRREQAAALAALGAGGCGQTGLGFADSGKYTDTRRSRPMTAAQALRGWGAGALVDRLAALLRELRPRAVLAMDPTRDPNYSLHAHHLACGAALVVAAGIAATEGVERWPIAGLWTALPSLPGVASGAPATREGAPGAAPCVEVAVDRRRKLAALACYPSQRYSTARLSAALADDRSDSPGASAEVWVRRARFAGGDDPIALLEGPLRR
jgi:LmbE family N-acetylglucosaminyl deacetylase